MMNASEGVLGTGGVKQVIIIGQLADYAGVTVRAVRHDNLPARGTAVRLAWLPALRRRARHPAGRVRVPPFIPVGAHVVAVIPFGGLPVWPAGFPRPASP
jgi:hypothetical protein